jgi:4'-phosphopantetheinyl transferase EntD
MATPLNLDGSRLLRLLPEGVVAEEALPALLLDELYPEERAQVVRAVDKRKAEYSTARVLVRRALSRLGAPAAPIVNDDERCPVWPAGIVGSITHTLGYCGVVVARPGVVESLGIDVEKDESVRVELYDKICTKAELTWLEGRPESERGLLVRTIFSAKEAFYKAQFPLTRQYLGFHDVEIDLDVEAESFAITLSRDAGRFVAGDGLEGRVAIRDGLIVSALSI